MPQDNSRLNKVQHLSSYLVKISGAMLILFMFNSPHPNTQLLFDYYSPFKNFIGILSIPHSGEAIPSEFKAFLTQDTRACLEDVDYKVNELVDIKALQEAGIAVISSRIHRVAVDLNRSPETCVLNWKNNSHGVKLVEKEATAQEIDKLRAKYYTPYYEMLKSMIQHLESISKLASFVDLHSMPSKPTAYHMKQNPKQKQKRPDFCVSDRHGKTCEKAYIETAVKNLKDKGYEALINDPYIGGYITEYVDQFKTNNIQIEINRALYMDEKNKTLDLKKSTKLKTDLTTALIELFESFKTGLL